MKYTFKNTNLITGYIKELLKDFNLPTCPVYKEEKTVNPGRIYLEGNYFVLFDNNLNKTNVGKYFYGRRYNNLTKNLVLKSNYYDQYTHEYLGDFLRFIRDYKNINLMSLYNCYSGYKTKSLEKYFLKKSFRDSNGILTDSKYIYYVLPVKFDQVYTISLECKIPFEIFLTFAEENENNYFLFEATRRKFQGTLKNTPILFSTKIDGIKNEKTDLKNSYSPKLDDDIPSSGLYWTQEENLRMVIKLPNWVLTSILVLEGNFTSGSNKVGTTYFPLGKNIRVQSDKDIEKFSRLSLLENCSSISYPFADRLVEYLLKMAITPDNKIPGNVGRIQEKVYSSKQFKGIYDIFDENLRLSIFDLAGNFKIKTRSESEVKTSRIDSLIIKHPIKDLYGNTKLIPYCFEDDIISALKYDADNDGRITTYDALTVLRKAAKLDEISYSDIAKFDTDGDGKITVSDALEILRIAANLKPFDKEYIYYSLSEAGLNNYLTFLDTNVDLLYYVDKDIEGLVRSL